MEIQKEAFEEKKIPSLSKWPKSDRIHWEKNHSFAWSFTNAILKFSLKTAGLCFLMSFNRSLQEYMRKTMKICWLWSLRFHENFVTVWHLKTILNNSVTPSNWDVWLRFATLSWLLHIFSKQHKLYLMIFWGDSKTLSIVSKTRTLCSLIILIETKKKTMEFDWPHTLVTPICLSVCLSNTCLSV